MLDADPVPSAVPRGARARFLSAALVVLAFVLGSSVLPSRGAAADDDVAAAEALLAKGDLPAAVEAFRRLSDAPGGEADVRVQEGLAKALLASGDSQGALAPLEALASKRGRPEDHLAHAEALVAVARDAIGGGSPRGTDVVPYLEDALLEVEKARGGGATLQSRVALAEAEARRDLGDPKKAREILSAPSLAADPAAQELIARASLDLGDFSAAAAAYTAAKNPRAAAWSLAAGRDKRATALYLALAKETPADEALLEEAGLAAIRSGDAKAFDEGLAALDAKGDARLSVLRARGRLAERGDRAKDAVPLYREVLAATPNDPRAVEDLGRALLSSAPSDEAVVTESMDLLVRALAASPGDSWAKKGLAYQAAKDGNAALSAWPDTTRLDRAVRLFRALAESDPTDSGAWAQYGNALRVLGRPTESIAAYDRAVAANEFDASAWNDRGLALLSAGDTAGALASFEHAAGLDPGDPSPHQNGGRLLWLEGRDDEAERHWRAATRSSRATGGHPMLFRSLVDRAWRCRLRPAVR